MLVLALAEPLGLLVAAIVMLPPALMDDVLSRSTVLPVVP